VENSLSFLLAADRRVRLVYALASAIMAWQAFPPYNLSVLIFVAWVPLLITEDQLYYQHGKDAGRHVWLWSALHFLLFNTLATWWIKNAAWIGAIAAILINTFLMSAVIYAYHRVKRNSGERTAWPVLVAGWLAMEHMNLRWDLDFPWLLLGNAFAGNPWMVQFYSATGVAGGTLWVWVVNILVFTGLRHLLLRRPLSAEERTTRGWLAFRDLFRAALVLFLPLLVSLYLYRTHSDEGLPTAEVGIIQPNVDPYNEKFEAGTEAKQLDDLLRLSDQAIGRDTRLLLWPETSIPGLVWLPDSGALQPELQQIRHRLSYYEGLSLLAGASAITDWGMNPPDQPAVRRQASGRGYTVHNSALWLKNGDALGVYHKSKLVAGVEKLPYPHFFGLISRLISVDLGGMSGQLGAQEQRSVFTAGTLRVAPVICYESVFGDYTTGYTRGPNGANLIAVVTNDGWWGETDGHRQHLAYARLRAIENHRYVVRSANTGISAAINARGDVLQQLPWWKAGWLRVRVALHDEQTFYMQYGDYLGRLGCFLFALLLLASWVQTKSHQRRRA
jgi:apolipoprotein N-acyltransferase